MSEPSLARDGWAHALLATWAALWCGDTLLARSTWFFHDLRHHHLPWRAWAMHEWMAGRPPVWAPIGHGYPLLADGQAGVLYPPNLIAWRVATLLFESPHVADVAAMNWAIGAHHALAASGAFWLARIQRRSAQAALVAGFGYGFSGFLVSHLVYLGMFEVMAWIPWLLGATALAVQVGGPWVWRAGLVLAMVWLAGHPQLALFATYAMLLVAGGSALSLPNRRRSLQRLALTVTLGVVLASPQLLATAELVGFGDRAGGVDPAFAATGSLPPEELVNAILPDLFGVDRPADVATTYHHRAGGYAGRGVSYWEDCFYLGVPVAMFALLGARARGARPWLVLAGVALIVMLGSHLPTYAILRLLPGMGYLRFPVRAGIFVVLAAGQLAAFGVDDVTTLATTDPKRLRRVTGAVALAAITAFIGLASANEVLVHGRESIIETLARFVHTDAHDPVGETSLTRATAFVDALTSGTAPLSGPVAWPVVVAAALAFGLARSVTGRGDPASAARLVGGLTAIDLLWFGYGYNPTTPIDEVVRRPAVAIEVLGNGRGRVTTVDRRGPVELDAERVSANLGLWWGLEDVIVPSPLRLTRNEAWLAAEGLDLAIAPDASALARNRALVDLSGVRWIVAGDLPPLPDALAEAHATVRVGSHDVVVTTWENPGAFPRAFAVGCTTPAGANALAAVLAVQDLHGTAVVEGPGLAACAPGSAGAVTVTNAVPGGWTLEVDLDRDALVVLTESYYPGWGAEVDGVPADLVRADDLFIGVHVPPGKHHVELAYGPWRLYALAALASAVAGVALARAVRPPEPPITASRS